MMAEESLQHSRVPDKKIVDGYLWYNAQMETLYECDALN